MNLGKLLSNGYANIQKNYQSREVEKKDFYRAGSAGCYTDGKFYGSCPRKSVHRRNLIQAPADFELHMIFTSGFAHEANLINLLLSSNKVEKVEVYDIPEHFTTNHPKLVLNTNSLIKEIPNTNIKISGRPDIVYTTIDGQVMGVEAKANTTEGKAMGASVCPYIAAICQAALYKDILNIDYQITYGCAASFGRFYFNTDIKSGKAPSEKEYPLLEYRKFPSGQYIKVPPSIYSYNIAIAKDGVVHTEKYGEGYVATPITIQGIYEFYKEVDKSIQNKILPDRPTDFELNGKVKYSSCQYCEYKDACDNYDKESKNIEVRAAQLPIGVASTMYSKIYDRYLKEVTSLVDIKKQQLEIEN